MEEFKKLFVNDDEFEQVFDVEQRTIDLDGLSRFLFTHAERFGVSFIDDRPMFSNELLQLFNFIELWKLMQADLVSPRFTSQCAHRTTGEKRISSGRKRK